MLARCSRGHWQSSDESNSGQLTRKRSGGSSCSLPSSAPKQQTQRFWGKTQRRTTERRRRRKKKSLSSSSHCLPLRHYAATSGSDVKTFLRSLEEVEGKKRITNQRATPDEGAEPRKPRRRLFVMTSQVTNSRAKSGAIKSRHLSESNNKTIKNNNKKNNKKNKIINKNRNNTIMKKTP